MHSIANMCIRNEMKHIWLIALVAVFAIGCNGDDDESGGPPGPRGGPPGGDEDVVVSVETAEITRGEFRVTGDYAGEFRSEEMTELSADVAGRVTSLNAHIGDEVAEGDVLAKIDDASLRQQVRELEANVAVARANRQEAQVELENLEANLRRRKPLLDRDMVSEREIEELESSIRRAEQQISVAEATIEQNEARLASAREDLGNTAIRAPFEGRIGMRYVERGAHVSPGQPIFSLIDDGKLFLSVRVPERHAPRVHRHTPVTVRVGAMGQRELTGEIHRIAPVLDSSTRSLRVDVTVDADEDLMLRPGMYARVSLELGYREDALTVDNQAILGLADGTPYVWKVVDGKAQRQSFSQLGLQGRDRTEIVEELEEGDRVVVRGHEKLEDGIDIRDLRSTSDDIQTAGGE